MRPLLLVAFFWSSILLTQTSVADTYEEVPSTYVAETSDDLETEFDDDLEAEFSQSTDEAPFDPLSGYNRVMTTFNDNFYMHVLFPIARGYAYVVPEGGRVGLSRFFTNLHFPIRFVNNLMQLKFSNSVEELSRFLINTTIGLFGFFDPAQAWFDLEAHDEDFGQTLGYYGVGGGFPIVLPILGPSNLRDSVSILGNMYLDPLIYWDIRRYNLLKNNWQALGIKSVDIMNEASLHADEYESLRRDAVELYPFFRNAYRQNREKEIEE